MSFRTFLLAGESREPEELEDGALDAGVKCAKVVERGVSFGEGGDAGEMEGRVGEVADGNESSGGEGHGRQKVVMGRRWCGGGVEGALVDDRPFEEAF